MKIGVVQGRTYLISDNASLDVGRASNGRFPTNESIFREWAAFSEWAFNVDLIDAPIRSESLDVPVMFPRQVFGIGLNYRSHADESGWEAPRAPVVFTKFPSCLAAATSDIAVSSASIDWEVELVVVMGRRAERVGESDAWGYVAGLTVGQDITDRALQQDGESPQWSLSKSLAGFGPIGPAVVTLDDVTDPDDLELGCAVDGQIMQSARTRDLIFSVPELIARLSAVCALLPGDLIFTGTPAGVGAGRAPQIFLEPGQTLTSWVKQLGQLQNRIVAGSKAEPTNLQSTDASGKA